MALSAQDRHHVVNLANSSNVAYTARALVPVMGIATVPGQLAAALTYWNAILSGGGLTTGQTAAVNDAISHLTKLQNYYASPGTAPYEPIR